MSRALEGKFGEGGGRVGERVFLLEIGRFGVQAGFVVEDQRFPEAVECVYISHHAAGSVEDSEMVTKQFLGNAAERMEGPFVHQDGLNVVAVAQPVEVCSPEVTAVLAHAPAATGK